MIILILSDIASDYVFWLSRMSYDDFKKYFTKVEICMLSPDSAQDSGKKSWAMEINLGSWQKHVSAGGCRNFIDSFALNPQYRSVLITVHQDVAFKSGSFSSEMV